MSTISNQDGYRSVSETPNPRVRGDKPCKGGMFIVLGALSRNPSSVRSEMWHILPLTGLRPALSEIEGMAVEVFAAMNMTS
jgi:hypothetical protein